MSDFLKQLASLSPKRLALLALELQEKLDAAERARTEPIAIIGVGCRFPGEADTPAAFWELLRRGGDGITEVPRDRWDIDRYFDPNPDAPGTMYSRYGGFLRGVDRFDPHFFGIAPREAVSMDPQQRLLLEVCWEALEDAAQTPTALTGSRTAVFVGITTNDYGQLVGAAGVSALDAYSMTGNALNFAAGRLSYVLGLQGPSLSVDTACSSSLVTVHLACQSLRSGESRLALAAGVNLILNPEPNIVLSRARMLASDGRCKTFDAAADGYVRGEGCGVVVLKRLSEAVADGDRVLAVVRASGVNQDGPSSGLTVPNGPAQQALLREVLEKAGVPAADVDYVEAHGTGTSLGDPIEVHALGAVFGEGRAPDRPLRIGALKTNVGHLEAAAGIAGIIKVVLALQHREIPPHLHLKLLNPNISLSGIPATIPTVVEPWLSNGHARLAGVSSFGASGTNAHVLLEEAPVARGAGAKIAADRPRHVLALSAKTPDALASLARRYADCLGRADAPLVADLCFTANTGRAHFAHRLAVHGSTADDLTRSLASFASTSSADDRTANAVAPSQRPKLAFVFTGQDAQRAAMGREVYETQPAFRAALDRCASILAAELEIPLIDVLYGGSAALLAQSAYGQPALFAVQYALSELWRHWGVKPAVALGHGVGEYVAATVSGVFSVEDALRLVSARGRLMQGLEPDGGKAGGRPPEVHTAFLEPMLEAFERVAATVKYSAPQLPVVTSKTGEVASGDELIAPEYWRRHGQSVTHTADSTAALQELGVGIRIELGPQSDWTTLGETLTRLWVAGVSVDWVAFDEPYSRAKVALPTYPFQRQRYWVDVPDRPKRASVEQSAGDRGFDPADWLYEIAWEPVASDNDGNRSSGRSVGAWIVCADDVQPGLVERMQADGLHIVLATPGDDIVRAHREMLAERRELQGVVYVAKGNACADVLALAQFIARDQVAGCTLAVVTTGAHAIQGTDSAVDPDAAPVWGLCRTLSAEHPEIRCIRIDLEPQAPMDADQVWGIVTSADRDNEVALRGGVRHVPRLVRSAHAEGGPAAPIVRGDRTYVITGGYGGLGLSAARSLVSRGARHLALIGRRGPSDGSREAIESLVAGGCEVRVMTADVAVDADVARIVADVAASMPPIGGVVHAAGALDDGVLVQQTWPRFESVLAPKVAGTWNLHRHTQSQALDFFVMFSSATSLFGNPGQGNYAAANAFLDAFAHYRRAQGLSALTINWGPWGEVGMAAATGRHGHERWRDSGVTPIATAEGLSAFEYLLANGPTQAAVMAVDWPKFLGAAREGEPAIFERFAPLRAVGKAASSTDARQSDLLERIARVSGSDRARLVFDHVRSQAMTVLGLDPAFVFEPHQGLRDVGLDSLMAVDLRNRLQQSIGNALPATLAFDCPTLEALTTRLVAELDGDRHSTLKPAAAVLRERSAEASTEAIAVVGLGCRFPGGASNPDTFWERLRDGFDAISEVPADRWNIDDYYDPDPDATGKMYTRRGAFLDRVDTFDPQFFGIAPREAVSLDPQQRLLLEVSWEALERAGLAPDRLMGTQTGVFIGISSSEYALLQTRELETPDLYFGTGSALSAAAGRLSYMLGLQGPSLSVDTACSSSLVAVHLAVQSLRRGECGVALAGGVNVLLAPDITVTFCRARMMARDGRCKTFDESADGYVRGEGCGIVVLKRLSDAVADGDSILAVIRGTAVNQDGRSSGLTVPNGPAQQALLRAALKDAHVNAKDIQYVEAHGTGTPLGDPIEVQALASVFGEDRPSDQPLVLGSVKTNIGHLEAAAGVAGLIKVVLALQHGEIPAHLHFRTPNPNIAWSELPVGVATATQRWPARGTRRMAGVSSFGFTGTNAHVVLEAPPEVPVPGTSSDRSRHVLALSARSEQALVQLAASYGTWLESAEEDALGDLCFTANSGRSHFSHRAAFTAASSSELRVSLAAFAASDVSREWICGRFEGLAPKVAWLFTGQGAQRAGMGLELYETQPTFRAALDRSAAILATQLETPLLDVLYGAASGKMDQTAYAQPALFAVEYALAELWRSWGVQPAVVLGHSIGEYVAACVAGVFSLADGLKLVAARGRLMQALPRGGGMVAVQANEKTLVPLIAMHAATVSIAAVNAPDQIVLAGAADALDAITQTLAAKGIMATALPVSHAFHSPLIEPMLDEFERLARTVQYHAPQIPVVSNVTGALATGDDLVTPGYWRRHAREAVRYAASVQALDASGVTVCLELGPAPVLAGLGRRTASDERMQWLPTLRPGQPEWTTLTDTLARAYVVGVAIDWAAFDADYARRKITIPTYPFQRQRYWAIQETRATRAATTFAQEHPLLGQRLRSPLLAGSFVFDATLDPRAVRYLGDHRVRGEALTPAAVYVELALAAARAAFADGDFGRVEDFAVEESLVLSDDHSTAVQIALKPGDGSRATFEVVSAVSSTDGPEERWTRHASGTLVASVAVSRPPSTLEDVQRRCVEHIDGGAYYAALADGGFEMGPGFRAIVGVFCGESESLGDIRIPGELAASAGAYAIHPVIFDACCHVAGASLAMESGASYMVVGMNAVQVFERGANHVWAHAAARPGSDGSADTLIADVLLLDDSNLVVAAIDGLMFRRVTKEALARAASRSFADWLYTVAWERKPLKESSPVPALSSIVTLAERDLAEFAGDPALSETADALPRVNALATLYAARALQDLGWSPRAGVSCTFDDIKTVTNIASRHERLLRRMLEMLVEDGLLVAKDESWEAARTLPADDPDTRARELARACPSAAEIVGLTSRCGFALAAILRGDVDPLEILFPGGSFTGLEAIYEHSVGARLFNRLVQTSIQSVVSRLSADQSLRVVEIGAGTGGTTASVLPLLPAERTRYAFTDLSPVFFDRAAGKFAAYPFVEYRRLDIERAPADQGFAAERFDIVIAANVLHATRSLADTLEHVKDLLAPGGLLVVVEATGSSRWLDITFGLTDGWWRFEDAELRPSHPLLTPRRWTDLLAAHGFVDTAILPPGLDERAAQAIVLGRGPESAAMKAASVLGQRKGQWLVLADAGGVGAAVADGLRARGADASILDSRALEHAVRTGSLLDGRSVEGIVHAMSLDAASPAETSSERLETDQVHASGTLLQTIHALTKAGMTAPIWVLTRRAQPAGSDDRWCDLSVAQAPIWGLSRVVALEHPELWGGIVDIDHPDPARAAHALIDEIESSDGEDQIAWRDGERFVARLVPKPAASLQPASLRADASYLITGGLGTLGLKLAQWLADHGAGHLVLLGRSGVTNPKQKEAIAGIEARGVSVQAIAADVASLDQMSALFARFGRDLPALKGVVHAATANDAGALKDLSVDRLLTMLRPKVSGTWVLHTLTRDVPLDFFVLFSSTTGLLGSSMLGHYAAANTFLDSFAHYRRSAQLPAVAVNWGVWEEMRASSGYQARVTQGGLLPLVTARALEAFGLLLGASETQITIANADWTMLKSVYEARRRRPFLERLGSRSSARPARTSREAGLVPRLEAARRTERHGLLVDFVRRAASQVLALPAPDIDVDRGLFDLGMDSLMSVDLKTRLEGGIGRSLPSTLAFNHPTVGALVAYIEKQLPQLFEAVDPAQRVEPISQVDEDDDLSEDELAALLADKLARVQ